MEMLINVKTNVIGAIVRDTEKGKVLLIDGVEKEYSASTLKRWWKSYQAPVVEEVAVEEVAVQTTNANNNEKLTDIANNLINHAKQFSQEVVIKETSSYTAIRVGKKTVAEVHCSAKGKTKIVVNSKSLDEQLIQSYINLGLGKQAPKSYGWTLDVTIDCDKFMERLSNNALTSVIELGIKYRSK